MHEVTRLGRAYPTGCVGRVGSEIVRRRDGRSKYLSDDCSKTKSGYRALGQASGRVKRYEMRKLLPLGVCM